MNSYFSAVSPLCAIGISVAWFSAGVFVHLIICRIAGTPKYMARGLACGFLLMLCLAVRQICTHTVNIVVLYYVLTLWLAYMMFFVNLMNSVTLKMLDFMAKRGGTLAADDFSQIFGSNSAIVSRLEAIKRNNFLRLENGRLYITTKGRTLVSAVRIIRRITGVTEAG